LIHLIDEEISKLKEKKNEFSSISEYKNYLDCNRKESSKIKDIIKHTCDEYFKINPYNFIQFTMNELANISESLYKERIQIVEDKIEFESLTEIKQYNLQLIENGKKLMNDFNNQLNINFSEFTSFINRYSEEFKRKMSISISNNLF